MRRWIIVHTSGRKETVDGYEVKLSDIYGTISIRTSTQWITFPIQNIESYRETL